MTDPNRIGQSGTSEPAIVVIFGASGDLTRRKLVPALHSLACEGFLHPESRVVGVARSEMSSPELSLQFFTGVEEYSRLNPRICALWDGFSQRVHYVAGDYDDADTFRRLGEMLDKLDAEIGGAGNHLFYLAIPPLLYDTVIEQLGQSGLNQSQRGGWTRIIIEKPFGHDLDSAQALNAHVHAVFQENQVYRIDHYLGKETVQNLLLFRFGNSIFEPLWNRNYVDHIQITMSETVGVGRRAGYYDGAGVLRDMLQNHLLQLLALTTMEPPAQLTANALRDEKVKVLRAVRPFEPECGVWGQYEGYRSESGVATNSITPTFIAQRVWLDNWRWQGVPIYVRSGKNLAAKTTEISLHFRSVPHLLFPEHASLEGNRISIYIQPNEGIHLNFCTKVPGAGMRAAPVSMAFHYGQQFGQQSLPDAYERLLLDAIQGDASLFARSDEIELAWGLVDRLNRAKVEPNLYRVGSEGPPQATAFIKQDGRAWLPMGEEHADGKA